MAAPTVLTVQQAPAFGKGVVLNAQSVDTANGNVFTNDGRTSIRLENNSGSPINFTFNLASSTRNGLNAFATTQVISVPANGVVEAGFLDTGTYNNAAGQVQFLCTSGTATVKLCSFVPTPV